MKTFAKLYLLLLIVFLTACDNSVSEQKSVSTSTTIFPTIQLENEIPTHSITSHEVMKSSSYPSPTIEITPIPSKPIFTETPTLRMETIEPKLEMQTDREVKMLNELKKDATNYKELVDFCTEDFSFGKSYYQSSLGSDSGYYLPLYRQGQLCAMAFFAPPANTWIVKWITSAGIPNSTQLNDLAKAVINDPFSFHILIEQCTKEFRAGSPVYVPYLDAPDGVYIEPFFNDKGLCLGVYFFLENGTWKWGAITDFIAGKNGDQYPEVNPEEVKEYIEKVTCKKVIELPQYVAQRQGHPPGPFWRVVTEDENIYFVIAIKGPTETDSTVVSQFMAGNSKYDFRMGIGPTSCKSP